MAREQHLDQYATELIQRFEDLTQWAIDNWPNQNFPLMQSDFAEARKEIANIAGPKLGEVKGTSDQNVPASVPNEPQYTNMNPTPWP